LDLGVRGKGYVVVGGTAGMGLAAARALAREGASVVVVGRDADRGKNAAEELVAAGAADAHGLAFDVSQRGAAVAAVDEAVRILGRLDGIAITMGTAGMMPIESDDDAWDTAFHDVLLATTRRTS
jgi:NAD(P)-dependent dehydrogenase (short-subunit alcohol dehydrogenase family)